jgi:two-component system chemotaxis response regulator CheY
MKKRILILDDEKDVREILKNLIESDPRFKVIGEASNGKEALEQYKKLKPDLITVDLIMPKFDGLQTVKDILNYDAGARVIVVTALLDKKVLNKAFELGVMDYIAKPFQVERVLSSLESLL